MTNKQILKTKISAVALSMALCESAQAVIQTGTDCDGKCDWVYDSEAEGGPSLVFTAKENTTAPLEIKNNYYRFYDVNGGYNLNLQPKNIIVGEGITAINRGGRNPLENVGIGGGKLTLPSTLTNIEGGASWGMKFSTIEINSNNLTLGPGAIRNDSPTGVTTIIMPASANIVFAENAIYSAGVSAFTQTLNIQCKGAKATCDESMAGVKATIEANGGTYKSDYYEERDADNKLLLKYHDNGYYKYDGNGNITESWNLDSTEQYDARGNMIAQYDKTAISLVHTLTTRAEILFQPIKTEKLCTCASAILSPKLMPPRRAKARLP